MTQPKPRHDFHVFDPEIFRLTGFTCYLCFEEFRENLREGVKETNRLLSAGLLRTADA